MNVWRLRGRMGKVDEQGIQMMRKCLDFVEQ